MAVSDLPVDEPRAKTRRAATGAVTTTTKAPLTPSGAPTLSTEEQRAKITFTLRVISLARLMFIRRTGRAPSSLAELADQRLMQAPVPVDGEQYESVDVANDDVFSVTTKSGLTVVLDTTTTGIGTPIPLAGRSPPGLDKKVFHALSAWRKAHGIGTGPMPRSAQELLPYFATASDGADYVEWLEYVGWPQR